ncbi:type I restriction endonuclease subunit R [Nocardia farcinica]|uniref:type I restriction endonuclease subunit R n=1 Tax=Nocardia farcinica TaxID=37329 RepID=UPI001895CFA6|nr:type I restriction endonuclease subunit R [Nocardia farcinica]MBF6522630.1 type I restriction endonuclease subunit R [Nocardia farcinica]
MRLDEESLETLVVRQMVDGGWSEGAASDYDQAYAIDLPQLIGFLESTQPDLAESLSLRAQTATRHEFLSRLQGEITRHGVVHVLRKGVDHRQHHVDFFYPTPTSGNVKATQLFAANRFTVTRQVHYSVTASGLSVDLVAFVNGLPVFTFELKNNITKQTFDDAVEQYKRDRDPRELLFQFGRCIAHFGLDDQQVRFCTQLKGKQSWFLPFDKGCNDGAGNPPNPDGIKTDYLWRQVLAPTSLANIIENYAQIVRTKNPRTGKKSSSQIFPRYHQLDVVRKLLTDVEERGAGRRYLIQHSAGSGKSNSIAWLAHQLTEVKHDGDNAFGSIIVVTDRVILDSQLKETIKSFMQVGSTVVHADRSGDLRKAIEAGRKIIITTVQKFPHILDDIGKDHRDRTFAIIIDEAHSSQGGKTAATMSLALSAKGAAEEDETVEDKINRIIESKKMLPNASYFAFTATPKNKTLQMFGEPFGHEGGTDYRPFHSYTMKQATQERFIVDVLENFTPVPSYYKLMKTVEDDPEFDTKRASKKLRAFVEGHEHAIRLKAEIMVDHFHRQVIAKHKIGGQARAMVVTSTVPRCIEYFHAIRDYLTERKSPYKAIVAFSGDHEYKGIEVNEARLNGFPSKDIADRIQDDPYRILVCADKFQTGYDEPLLHTMYVDKPLSGVKAVQTLSRLNRAHPAKHDAFVLDFANSAEDIAVAFAPYYRTTVLSQETDPNKLHDLVNELNSYGIYLPETVDKFAELYLAGVERDQLDPLLDVCVAEYIDMPDEDDQVAFKGTAKAFTRTYNFLSAVLPFGNPSWEKLSIFLDHLIPKLPAPREDDLSAGILETIDMESYRVEKRESVRISLSDEDGELGPVPTSGGGHVTDPEMDRLSSILQTFNDQFGNIEWTDADRVRRLITEDIPRAVAADEAYQNAQKNNDPVNARVEHDRALARAMLALVTDDTELFKQFSDNEGFKRWLSDAVFQSTYGKSA